MRNYVIFCLLVNFSPFNVDALWDTEVRCPLVCTCRLEHLKETAIHRFMKKHEKSEKVSETDYHLNNEVLYEEDMEDDLSENNPVLRAATCILQTETEPLTLIESLPKNIEALTLIQGAESGNKSVNFTHLQKLPNLLIVELHGSNTNEKNGSVFNCVIDTPIPEIRYLNFDKISIKVSKQLTVKHESEHEEVVKFKYTKQITPNSQPLTLVQRGKNKEILPYNKYIQQENNKNVPVFVGFDNLILLRISNCELKNINWEMFDGLQNLQYLILEKNNLKQIPDFAFYGSPNLKSLSLAWNNLLNMQITDLAGLLELEYLDLSHNNFSLLSELSFPPFPKLKLANFANNPINVIFPSTFEVMNTTDSMILGGDNTPLTLLPNSFLGLKLLKKLTLQNLILPVLKRELLYGMSNLTELIMSGNITKFEFDAFVDVLKLDKLIAARCLLQNISMDAFNELGKLEILDLSQNQLEYLHPGTFDPLNRLKELYLNKNKMTQLPQDIFSQIHPKLIRLNNNPWHCSCKMSNWKPMVISKIKQKVIKNCDSHEDKGIGCDFDETFQIKYVFESRVAPICASPKKFVNWNVFHVMRKQLRCIDYKPKYKKKIPTVHQQLANTISTENTALYTIQTENKQDLAEMTENKSPTYVNNKNQAETENNMFMSKMDKLKQKIEKHPEVKDIYNYDIKSLHTQDMPIKISLFPSYLASDEDNNLNYVHTNLFPSLNMKVHPNDYNKRTKIDHQRKTKKYRKGSKIRQNTQTPSI